MKHISILIALGMVLYFVIDKKAGAIIVDSGGTDNANPLYFSLGKSIMGQAQTLSNNGLAAIKRREGFSAVVYSDPPGSGHYSIGYGHQIQPGESFDRITETEATQILLDDITAAENAVNSNISQILTQSQFDSLVSFCFNVGVGAFKNGSVIEKINAGNFDAAMATMKRYINSGGKPSAALVARRSDEVAQFKLA